MHGLDLGLYSHPKEFWGNGVRTDVNSKGRIPSTGSSEENRQTDSLTDAKKDAVEMKKRERRNTASLLVARFFKVSSTVLDY